jgi:hypothetical protein
MRKSESSILSFLVLSSLIVGCGEDPHGPAGWVLPGAPFIDESVVLDRSEVLPAFSFDPEETTYVFDLSEVSLVQSGTYDDLHLQYWTSTGCDEDTWLYNTKSQVWTQVGYYPEGLISCVQEGTQQKHLLSARNIRAADSIDESGLLTLRGPVSNPEICVLDYHPDYRTIAFNLPDLHYIHGIAYDGQALWVLNDSYGRMYRMSPAGVILEEFPVTFHTPSGLAFDGEQFWIAEQGRTMISSWAPARGTLCSFSDVAFSSRGLACGSGRMWITHENGGGDDLKIFSLDPALSCTTGEAAVTDTVVLDAMYPVGIDWDGSSLLVITGREFRRVTPTGEVLEVVDNPVVGISDIAWDGQGIWSIHWGPRDFPGNEPLISRFLLR